MNSHLIKALRETKLTRKFRSVIASWPGYQMTPSRHFIDAFKMKARVLLSLSSETLQLKKSEKRRILELRKSKERFREKSILILGNGPSIRQLDLEKVRNFQNRGGFLGVMNDFPSSYLKDSIRPDFFFISDPAYWKESSSASLWRAELELYLGKFPRLILCQPCNRDPISSQNETLYFDYRSSAGLIGWSRPDLPWGLPGSVALIAISMAKYLGFSPIYFAGLDSNSFSNFFVNELNEVLFDIKSNYFDQRMTDHINDSNRFKKVEDWPINDLSDIHYAQAIFLRDMRKICKEICINVGEDRTNDSAWRACLI